VRVPNPYVSVDDMGGTTINCSTDAAFDPITGFFDFAAWANPDFNQYNFIISTTTNSSIYHAATNIIVSASGWVTFDDGTFSTVSSPADMEPLIADPAYPNLYLLGIPYASADFIIHSVAPDYVTDAGEYGGPLLLRMNIQTAGTTSTITFQWDGYSQTTLDPVSFQVALITTSAALPTDPVSGQMQFNYGVLPGTWAGNPWLAASQLTSNPETSTLQIIQIVDQPRMNESIYFGTASYQSTAQLVRSVPVPSDSLSSLQNRVVAPRRLAFGAVPDGTVTATFCTYDGNFFEYLHLEYDWAAETQRIASLNGSPVGSSNLNTPSLADAIVATGSIYGTQLAPKLLSAVSIIATAPASPIALTLTQRNAILSSPVNLGPGASILSTAGYLPATSKCAWTPSSGDYYASTLLYVQPTPNPREVFNYASVAFQITFNYLALVRGGENNGILALQLAAADSTSLLTQFADDLSPTCVLIYAANAGADYVVEYRSGYGGVTVGAISAPQSLLGVITVNGVLTYNTTGFTQRPNVLVVGRPPRAGNGPSSSPLGAERGVLGAFEMELGVTRVADMRSTVQAVPTATTQYAITTERNVARPSFFNPVSLQGKQSQ